MFPGLTAHRLVVPGFVDIHSHGAVGADTGLASGSAADLIVLDGSAVVRVMRRGEWLESSS